MLEMPGGHCPLVLNIWPCCDCDVRSNRGTLPKDLHCPVIANVRERLRTNEVVAIVLRPNSHCYFDCVKSRENTIKNISLTGRIQPLSHRVRCPSHRRQSAGASSYVVDAIVAG